MKCNIEYVGKLRNGTPQYYCTTHKSLASDKQGKKLDECLCYDKELFDFPFDIKKSQIKELKILYSNILTNKKPELFINGKSFNGVFVYDNCVLTYKDLGGIMLSKLNNISLEEVKCSHCNKYHSDNGKFAYTPHKTHLCLYCGHLFRVKERNIGNELAIIFTIPDILLKDETLFIEHECSIEYDLLKGKILVNNEEVNKIIINNKEFSLIHFLNDILKNEF